MTLQPTEPPQPRLSGPFLLSFGVTHSAASGSNSLPFTLGSRSLQVAAVAVTIHVSWDRHRVFLLSAILSKAATPFSYKCVSLGKECERGVGPRPCAGVSQQPSVSSPAPDVTALGGDLFPL